jgi:hypothetical protein
MILTVIIAGLVGPGTMKAAGVPKCRLVLCHHAIGGGTCRDGKAESEEKGEARIELDHVIVMWIMNVKTPVIVMVEGKDSWGEGTTQWERPDYILARKAREANGG